MKSLKDILIELERCCIKPEIRSSVKVLDKLLANDFLEIPSTGVPFNKTHALDRIPNEVSPIFTQQDYELRILSDDVAQLVYKATIQRKGDNTIHYSIRHSIWKSNGNTWQMWFHQATPCNAFEIDFSGVL